MPTRRELLGTALAGAAAAGLAAPRDDLARICAEQGRWEFFLAIAPWRFKGATSSPVNPLAIF